MSTLSPTATLCRDLISRRSVTPEDGGCQALIADRLNAVGFRHEQMRFGDVDNQWSRCGDSGPLFVFAGHTDVVPTGDEKKWSSGPFAAEVCGDLIIGRGAADMKGGIAAMVTAVERYLATTQPAGSIAFLLTSDEEGPAINGTCKVIETLQARSEQIDWCLVGEPTSQEKLGDTIKNGRRGSLSAQLTVVGRQGHVAYPHLADNPVHKALAALRELVMIEWDQGDNFFPATTLQISNVHAGTGVGNVIPGDLDVAFNLRFGPAIDAQTIKARVNELLSNHKLEYTLEWSLSGHPFITEPGSLTAATQEAILDVCGIDAVLNTGGGTSDGRFIAPTGAQVIELGPLNASIHQIDECVSISDLDQLSRIYEQLLRSLLGSPV